MSPRNEKRGTRSEESRNEDTLTDAHRIGDPFVAFWQAYPRKVGKTRARSTWQKLKPPLQAVLAALAWQTQTEQWRRDGGQFIPHPTTYLTQGRWEDEAPASNHRPITPAAPDEVAKLREWELRYGKAPDAEAMRRIKAETAKLVERMKA